MARSLNGTSDVIYSTSKPMSSAISDFTMSIWVYFLSTGGEMVIIGNGSDADGNGLALEVSTTFQILFFGIVRHDSGYAPSTGQWYHLALVNTAGSSQVWVNGVAEGAPGSTTPGSSPSVWAIGADQYPSHGSFIRYLDGNIADAAFWERPLVLKEIVSLANGTRPWRIPTPKFWMPLDGLVSPEVDLSGNANNGTLAGTSFATGPPFNRFTWTRGDNPFLGSSPPPPSALTPIFQSGIIRSRSLRSSIIGGSP